MNYAAESLKELPNILKASMRAQKSKWNNVATLQGIWVKTNGITNKRRVTACVYYHVLNQGKYVNNAFQKQTADFPKKHEIIVLEDFNYSNMSGDKFCQAW